MTPLAELLDRIGWSRPEAARRLQRHRTTIDEWANGTSKRGHPASAPDDVLARLQRIAEAVERETA